MTVEINHNAVRTLWEVALQRRTLCAVFFIFFRKKDFVAFLSFPCPTHRKYILKHFESIKAAALPQSPSIADHLLRLLWIREVKFEMDPPTKDELFAMAIRVFARGKFSKTPVKMIKMEQGFAALVQKKCIRSKNKPVPSETFENGWAEVYSLTQKGKHYAERMVETEKEIFARMKSPPIAPATENVIVVKTPPQATVKKTTKSNSKTSKSLQSGEARARRSDEMYENPVMDYLIDLRESVLAGRIPSARIANLTALEIAEYLKKKDPTTFWAKITSIKQKIGRTDAWDQRKETFRPVFETGTFINRHNTNSAYQDEVEVQRKR